MLVGLADIVQVSQLLGLGGGPEKLSLTLLLETTVSEVGKRDVVLEVHEHGPR